MLRETQNRLCTGLPELDAAIGGGIRKGSLILLSGNAGSGKTIFAAHFLNEGLKKDEHAIYLSFAESRKVFETHFAEMGFQFSKNPKFIFLESPTASLMGIPPLVEALLSTIQSTNATRLVIDSITAVSQSLKDGFELRQLLHNIFTKIVRELEVTTLVLAEVPVGTERVGVGIEEFVADGIFLMKSNYAADKNSGQITIMKLRGTEIKARHLSFSFTPRGITTFAKESFQIQDGNNLSAERLSTGIKGLDDMLSPKGFAKGSVNLVSGATGTGKTVLSTQYANEAAKEGAGSRCLFLTYEDIPSEIYANAKSLGLDIPAEDQASNGEPSIKIVSLNADEQGIDQHISQVKKLIADYQPTRLVIDSLSAAAVQIDNASDFDRYVRSIRKFSKELGITTVCTIVSGAIGDAQAFVTESRASSYFDSIILLRYVEIESAMNRSIIVLKARGAAHDKSIREFEIRKGEGIVIKEKFAGVENILSGSAHKLTALEFTEREKQIETSEENARVERRLKFEQREKEIAEREAEDRESRKKDMDGAAEGDEAKGYE